MFSCIFNNECALYNYVVNTIVLSNILNDKLNYSNKYNVIRFFSVISIIKFIKFIDKFKTKNIFITISICFFLIEAIALLNKILRAQINTIFVPFYKFLSVSLYIHSYIY